MNIYTCKQCGSEFKSYNPNPKFCSLVCKGDSQAPEIDVDLVRTLYLEGYTQEEIGRELDVSQKSIFKAMKRHGIEARSAAKRDQWGDSNSSWKGQEAGYAALHRRIYSLFGKPVKCSRCDTEESKNYDYANLTGNYTDINDYAPMCRSCHWKYDKKIMNIMHMRDKL